MVRHRLFRRVADGLLRICVSVAEVSTILEACCEPEIILTLILNRKNMANTSISRLMKL